MNRRIKELRTRKELTQKEFAEKIGLRDASISMWEAGKSVPSGSAIALICKTFNVNEEWLRTGNGKMFADPHKDELDMLLDKRGFSKKEKAFLRYAYELPKADMDAIVPVAENLEELLSQVEDVANELDEIDAEVEAYRQELISARETKRQ